MPTTAMDERVLAVLPDLYALVLAEQFPARALAIVRGVVGGDKGDYTEVDLRSGQFRVLVDPEPAGLSDLREVRRAHMREPLCRAARAHGTNCPCECGALLKP